MIRKGTGPVFSSVRALVEESPLPWTWGMLRHWMGWSEGKASTYLIALVAHGYIWRIEKGLYGPMSAKPESRHSFPMLPKRIGARRISDDDLARYGFNL